ncbi:MAG: hypothetical protein HMLKMBBP_00924 [Planctomycetes bacterium]|nr:hypothetical protein [Planctomycetota bacterium]
MRSDERRWILIRTFYGSYVTFHALFGSYERRVMGFAERYGVDRKELQLPPEELETLLDASSLEKLRDGDLSHLREQSHRLFRTATSADPFDSHVSNIYHEVSLLKEEHFTVRDESMRIDPEEYERYYREVNVYYPKRLKHVRNLYGRARRRLEQILPSMGRGTVVVRSSFLFGEQLVREVYRDGLRELYRHMYPDGGALQGFTLAADSFLNAGFGPEAAAALRRALAEADEEILSAEDDGAIRALEERKDDLARKLARAEAAA